MNEPKNVWRVEGRWEATRESIAEARYFTIEDVGGNLEAAKRVAQDYLYRRVSRNGPILEWAAGTSGEQRAYYATHFSITFRIS